VVRENKELLNFGEGDVMQGKVEAHKAYGNRPISYLRMTLSEQFVDDDEAFVARNLPHIERSLKEVGEDLLGALFSPRRKDDVYSWKIDQLASVHL